MNVFSLWATLVLALTAVLSEGKKGIKRPTNPRPALLRLHEYLLANYTKGARPVLDWRKTTTVAIDVMVYAILNVDEKNQVLTTYIWYRQFWTDEFLVWDPADFDDLRQISVLTEKIWVPDIMINEFVELGKSPDIPYVYVSHDGRVQNYKPIQVVAACSLDIYNFPFDVQNCTLTFTSWLHHIQDINISLWRSAEVVMYDRSVFMNQGEWELLYVGSKYSIFNLGNNESDGYSEMRFFLVIRRRPLFYAVNLLLPSIFLMVMDIIGFYLPPDSGERVSFKITLLLGYSVFLIIVSDTLPATAIGTPLIGVYFIVCMALLVISLTETILIVRLVHKQDLQPHVPAWLRHLVLVKATALLCLRNRHRLNPARYHGQHPQAHREKAGSSAMTNHFESEGCAECDCERRRRSGSSVAHGDTVTPEASVLQEIVAIRRFLEKRDEHRDIAKEWLEVGYVLDTLLFRVYLLGVLAYAITLGTLWAVWHYA